MATNYPILTSDSITWSKEALDFIQATKTEPCNMIAELVITMEAAKEAVNELQLDAMWNPDTMEIQYVMDIEEFLNSDLFINVPANQCKVIEWVLSKYITWKE